MNVIVKYQIIDSSNLRYGMFKEDGEVIQNKRIKEKYPLGGIASNLSWLEQDVHRCTDEIKEMFPQIKDIKYILLECDIESW